jgi:hypothetical protein
MPEFRVVTYRGKFAAEYTENGKASSAVPRDKR